MAGLDRPLQTLNQLSQSPGKLVPYNVIIEAAQVLAEVIPDRFCKCRIPNLRL
jgi:predicted RNA methylase